MVYRYRQQLLKYKPIQIFILAALLVSDFFLITTFIFSILFHEWLELGLVCGGLLLTIFVKYATTFLSLNINFAYCDKTFEIKAIFPYRNATLLKCNIDDIARLQLVFSYSDNREKSEEENQKLSRLQKQAVDEFVNLHNIKNFKKAFVYSCCQDIYMLELTVGMIYFVALDDFMKSLLCHFEEKFVENNATVND